MTVIGATAAIAVIGGAAYYISNSDVTEPVPTSFTPPDSTPTPTPTSTPTPTPTPSPKPTDVITANPYLVDGKSLVSIVMGDSDASSYYAFGSHTDGGGTRRYGLRYSKSGSDILVFDSPVAIEDGVWHHYIFVITPAIIFVGRGTYRVISNQPEKIPYVLFFYLYIIEYVLSGVYLY